MTRQLLGTHDGLIYAILDEDRLEEAVHCTFNQFLNFEPATRVLRPPAGQFRTFVASVVTLAVEEQLSLVAIDPETDELAGVLLSDDFGRAPVEHRGARCISPILSMLSELGRRYAQAHPFGPGEVFHPFMSAVWPRFQGRHVYQTLFELNLALAARKGFRRVVAECTSEKAQQLLIQKLGHRPVASSNYDEFQYEGGRPFAGLTMPPACVFTDHTILPPRRS